MDTPVAKEQSGALAAEEAVRAFDAQIALLADASTALIASPHTADVLAKILEFSRRFAQADAYAVWRKRPGESLWSVVSSAGLSESYAKAGVSEESASTILARGALIVEDTSLEPSLDLRRDSFAREGIRSILVVPLNVHGEPAASLVFYWKTAHRFTPSEIRIASALGNMAASALGAAELREREAELTNAAQISAQRAAFLADAGALLASSLDYGTTLRSVAKLAIARFADWCAVDLAADGKLERVVLEHIEPAKILLAQQYREKYPPHEDDVAYRVLRSGEPMLIEYIPDELLAQQISDHEQLAMLRKMGVKSVMITPMTNRGRTMGLLTFVNSKPDRAYTHSDLALAQELARQAAIAIDNARLFAESQEAQAALRKSNDELRRANDDLNRFAYSASHDLQEPLRMVSAYTQLLQKRYSSKLDTSADLYINYAVQGARRMEALVRDILAYTQSATAEIDGSAPVSASAVLSKALSNLQQAIERSGATIDSGALPTIHIAEIHLLQLFQNLIGNAIKYAGHKPALVNVRASRSGDAWLFSVQDNGIGIDPAYQNQVFGLFKRLHTTAEYEGTGIGLAICKKIVERYGGRIWVESALGLGSTFYFTLPDKAPAKP